MSLRGLAAAGGQLPVGSGAGCRHRSEDSDHWSRRQFLVVAGAAAGAAVTVPLWADDAGAEIGPSRVPKQVPGFSPLLLGALGVEVPFFLPIEVDPFITPFDQPADPLTIGDFNGDVGVVEADGVSTDSDGIERRWACDVRFMDGVYRDRNDKLKRAAFAFY